MASAPSFQPVDWCKIGDCEAGTEGERRHSFRLGCEAFQVGERGGRVGNRADILGQYLLKNLFSVDGYRFRRADAQPHLIPTYLQHGDLNLSTDHYALVRFAGKNQHSLALRGVQFVAKHFIVARTKATTFFSSRKEWIQFCGNDFRSTPPQPSPQAGREFSGGAFILPPPVPLNPLPVYGGGLGWGCIQYGRK